MKMIVTGVWRAKGERHTGINTAKNQGRCPESSVRAVISVSSM